MRYLDEAEKILGPESHKIFGPPGTGKTNYLITKLIDIIDNKKIHPKDICYITFTNKGIDEVRERLGVLKKTEGYESFSTIHGLCNRYIKGESSKLVEASDFEYWAKSERGDVKKEYGEDLDNNFILNLYNLQRVSNTTLEQSFVKINERNYKWKYVKYYVDSWHKYKENNKLHDFTDQILFALKVNQFQKYKAVFLDEAQDSSWCQWQVIDKLLEKNSVDYLYIAGDDDQAIFDWNGGDVNYFLNQYSNTCENISLTKSRRLSQEHINFASLISDTINKKQEKKYIAKKKDKGYLQYTGSFMSIPVDNGESWTIMVTGSRIMNEMKNIMMRRRLWFKQTTAKGYVHYPVGSKILSALKCYFNLQKGKYVSKSDLLIYRTLVKPKNFMPKQLEGLDKDQLYNREQLEEMFDFDFSIDWKEHFANVNNPEWKKKFRYIKDCINNNVDIFTKKPAIKMSTIHGMKGGEDDNIVLVGNMEQPFYNKYKSNEPDERDAITRMFYVGSTRAKKAMYVYICSDLPYRFNFDRVFKQYNERKKVA